MLDDFLSMFVGLSTVTKEKVEDLTELLVQKGKMQREEARKVAEEMLQKGREEKEAYSQRMQEMMDGMKNKMVTKEDINRLEAKIDDLYNYLREKDQ